MGPDCAESRSEPRITMPGESNIVRSFSAVG
jgi:hypothetical protein